MPLRKDHVVWELTPTRAPAMAAKVINVRRCINVRYCRISAAKSQIFVIGKSARAVSVRPDQKPSICTRPNRISLPGSV